MFIRKSCIQLLVTETMSLFRCMSSKKISSTDHHDIYWWNSNIMNYFKLGDIETACQLFHQMPQKNLVTWNCMISGYVRNHRVGEARKVFDAMPNRNIISWTAMLTGYAKCGLLEEARYLFDRMPNRNVVCWNSMISGYICNGRVKEAQELFNEMPVRNSISWATMIDGYFRHGDVNEALKLFDEVPVRTTSVYNAMLSGYAEMGCLDNTRQFFSSIPQRDVASWTTMITCYSQAGEMKIARSLFEEMPQKDVAAWTAIIRGYMLNRMIEDACKLFNEMPSRDIVAWNSMVGGYVQNRMLEDALQLFAQMPRQDIVSWNTILQGYVQQNDKANALNFFEKMPQKNETSWNIMISGCQSEEALLLFCKMMKDGFKPDQGTFTSLISVCGALAILGWGRSLHLCVIRTGYENDVLVMSSLISMYSKCGFIDDATLVFERMKERDTVTWNAMIVSHAYHGSAAEALELFTSMIQAGTKPDQVTFLGLMTACSHSGLVDKAWEYLNSMLKNWNLVPELAHFSCMIDILGRSGLLVEAYNFIKQLDVCLPTYIWETLLNACRVHGNWELGELIAKKILNGQPSNGGAYVLLSNTYAARGMWDDVANVRALMKHCGAKKELACSWIEMNGRMSRFLYNDRSHPLTEDIFKELESLYSVMEMFG